MAGGAFGTAVSLLVAATIHASAQPSVPPVPFEIDPKAATTHFSEIFRRTCYQHRHKLGALVNERPLPEFEKVPRAYPARDEAQRLTVLAEWGVWSRGVSYTIVLAESDAEPGVLACSLMSPLVNKSAVTASMLTIDDLSVFKEVEDGDTKQIGLIHRYEPKLRVLCMQPRSEQLYHTQCSLWFWRDAES